MKNKIKIITLCLIFSITLIGCSSLNSNANNTVIKEIGSPDGDYTAFCFIRDLGATTKASYQLSILNKGEKLGDTTGNVFITYGEFDVEWDGNSDLIVNIKDDEEIFKKLEQYKGIQIKYETLEKK